jgi:SAM-dependent methyltransferase
MVGVATQKAHEVRKRSGLDVEIIRQDCLAPAPYGTKFDLITVGQALHWFDVKKFLQHSKQMINPYGKFACLGYYVDRIDTP